MAWSCGRGGGGVMGMFRWREGAWRGGVGQMGRKEGWDGEA